MTDELFAFIDEYCQHDWRNNDKFYVWIPIYYIDDFIELIDFNIFEYGFIENCSLFKDELCVELSYFVNDLKQWFHKES